MNNLPWSPYDPDWAIVPEEALAQMPNEQRVLYDIYTFRNQARTSPLSYGQAFNTPIQPYPHVVYLSNHITALIDNQLYLPSGAIADKVLVTMPPRHGKSFLISEHTPPWYLSRFPNNRVILTSYEGDFAAQWGKKSKDLFSQNAPAFGLALDMESKANARWDLERPYRGGMQTAGTGGPITGKGGHLLIGDDWVKNSEDARSQAWRDNAWEWVISTFLTRKEPTIDPVTGLITANAKIILLMTRWHEDDPVGRLLAQEPDQWYHIDLPAIAREADPLQRQPGEALAPSRFPIEELHATRKTLGTYWFEALYQGRPTPEGGGLFKSDHMGYWRSPSERNDPNEGRTYANSYVLLHHTGVQKYVSKSDMRYFLTADLAATTTQRADYSVFSTWGYTPDMDLLLISLLRSKMESGEHLPTLRAYVQLLRDSGIDPTFVGIEKITFGLSLVQNAIRANFVSIRPLTPDKDKVARAIPASNILEQGRLYVPRDADITADFLHELYAFDNGAHDDQVDTLAYAAWIVDRWMPKSKPTPNSPSNDRYNIKASNSVEERIRKHLLSVDGRSTKQRQRAVNWF